MSDIKKVKVNAKTGMVALIARDGLMNHKKGDVFGKPVGTAVKLLKAGNVDLVDAKDLPQKAEFKDVDVDLTAGTVGKVKPLGTKDLAGDEDKPKA